MDVMIKYSGKIKQESIFPLPRRKKHMTEKKLRMFEEKINAFLKHFESGITQLHSKDYFPKKYAYLSSNEIETLFFVSATR